jgi:DNA-binding Lrp family transcriptional regulator
VSTEENKTVALALVKTELGDAYRVAEAAYAIDGVIWTMIVTGPYDVVVAIRVDNNSALGDLVVDRLQGITGVRNPTTLVGVKTNRPPPGVEMFP